MTDKQAILALKRIQKELQQVLNHLEGSDVSTRTVGTCLWCKGPILEGEKTVRGVHVATCYNFARDRATRPLTR